MNRVELKAGHELDAWVAEKVMGWHRSNSNKDGGYYYWHDTNNQPMELAEDIVDWPSVYEKKAWSPSTNISAAWHVVDKLIERNIWLSLAPYGQDYKFIGWSVEIFKDADLLAGEVEAETASLAICLAALKAVEAG